LARTIAENNRFGVRHGAIVVIKLPENELLALVGSPDPTSDIEGNKINMALEPRPIGSTAKPFIYLKAFEKGARPYTRVVDREYSYSIGTGYSIYPKNYDGQYHGEVSLQYALSNSLNVPAVKTLEFVGLESFYSFLVRSFNFKPLRELQSYEYGIALGGLEMDPLTLSYLFTIFPNNGILKPLYLNPTLPVVVPMSAQQNETVVAEPQFTHLVTALLSDRLQGVEQFGLVNNLNLPEKNYAVKTGTSRDYHDTWTVGFTPDFLVTTWLGNAENKPLQQVTGASGAGKVWQQTMELLMNSPYNKHTPLDLSGIESQNVDRTETFGLSGDNVKFARNIMLKDTLILHPHQGDLFLLEKDTQIPLIATKEAEWFLNGKSIGIGEKIYFTPTRIGHFELSAKTDSKSERVSFDVQNR
jgi:penicillin-binding protein 1C